jgi:hypothetical protein
MGLPGVAPETSSVRPHQESAFGFEESLVAVRAVAVPDVIGSSLS